MTTIMKNEPHCLNCGETKHQYANNCECGEFVCGRWMNPYYGEGEEQEDVEILDSQEQPIGVAKNQEEWDTLTAKSGLKMERTENATLRSKNAKLVKKNKELVELLEKDATLRSKNAKLVKKNKELVELLEKARDEGAELENKNEKVLDCYDYMEMKWFSITLAFDGARKCHKKAEARVAELEKELAEFREWNAKMRCMDNEGWCRRCGAWEEEQAWARGVCKVEKWGYVCGDCLHHLDNEDHETCKECNGCKDCGCNCDDEE
jgi:hypothetical protein